MFICTREIDATFGSFHGQKWSALLRESVLVRSGQWFYRCQVERLIADVNETMKS